MALRSRTAAIRERLVPPGAAWLLASGALLGLAYPPFHLLLPSFIALVPYLVWVERLPGGREGRAQARRGGFFLGWIYYTLVLYWLVTALIWYTWLAVLAFLATVAILAGILAYTTLGLHLARRRLGWPLWLVLPVFWTSNEWVRGHLPDVAFPWMQLGDTLTGFPWLVGAADVVGSRGLSFWLCLSNGLLAVALLRWRAIGRPSAPGGRTAGGAWRPVLAFLLALALPAAYSLYRWNTLKLRPAARVAAIQPNVPEEMKFEREAATLGAIQATERLVESRLTGWQGSLDLLVLPETALPVHMEPIPSRGYPGRPQLMRWAERLAWGLGAPVLFGGLGDEDLGDGEYAYFNSAFLATPEGTAVRRYDKRRLVPVVERIPFLNPKWFSGIEYLGGFGVGQRAPLYAAGEGRFGVLICYESIYPGLAREYRRQGANFLVNITNDAWFGRSHPWWSRTSALWQHPAHLVMRAVETRTGIVRSANTGISLFLDPLGRMRDATPLFTETAITGEVLTTEGRTLFVRFGDVLGWASILAAAGAAGALARRRWRLRESAGERGRESGRPGTAAR
ncbi:MAG: apolipoprotein N-acyltransferase [Gemmatimonadota bacterium]